MRRFNQLEAHSYNHSRLADCEDSQEFVPPAFEFFVEFAQSGLPKPSRAWLFSQYSGFSTAGITLTRGAHGDQQHQPTKVLSHFLRAAGQN
jgi:hypothetical protein